MSLQSAAGSSPRLKTTLFCPHCGHESPVDGDWRVETVSAGPTLVCPDCSTTVHSGRWTAVPSP